MKVEKKQNAFYVLWLPIGTYWQVLGFLWGNLANLSLFFFP
jgi:hypothetical protein